LIFITLIDIKPGFDDETYEALERLKGDGGVTPLLIGRIFEEADILLLLHSDELEALDDYLINNVRELTAAEELIVVPIYEFVLLPSFDSVVEIERSADESPAEDPIEAPTEPEELLMFMARIDIAPGMDRSVHRAVVSLRPEDSDVIPLMAGHTFHSKEFDLVLFFLANSLEAAWEFGKRLRALDGVWDTYFALLAHFEAMVPLWRFREYASSRRTLDSAVMGSG
jgi:hypothetical protein